MKKRLIIMMLAVTTAVSFTACSDVEANTSRTSSVGSSSIAESTESITSTTTDSKADTTTTASSESEVSSTTTTNSSSEDTTTESTSSTSPKEEKIEERDVYDEDGKNVVDKIKVKVVDGVAYTIGEKSDDKCILDGVPLYTNDPEFPSGDILTIVQTVIYMKGEKVTQKEIFEKYADYHTPDEWYEEDYVKYGPMLCEEKLVQDPRLEPTNYFNGGLGNVAYYCERFFEDKSVKVTDHSLSVSDIMKLYDRLKILIEKGYLTVVYVNNCTERKWEWVTREMETQGLLDGEHIYLSVGYRGENFIVYDVKLKKIIAMNCTILNVYCI